MKKLLIIIFLPLILVSCDFSGGGGNSNSGENGNNNGNENGGNNAVAKNIVPVLLRNTLGTRVNYTILDNNADIYKTGYLLENEEQIITSYKKGNYKIKFTVGPWLDVSVYNFTIDKQCIVSISGTSYPWDFTIAEADFEVDRSPKSYVSVTIKNPFGTSVSFSIIDDEAEIYKSGSLLGGENQFIESFKTGKFKIKFSVSPWGSAIVLKEFTVTRPRDIVFAGTSSPWNFYITE